MPYVQRDLQGTITGLFARPQPGRAKEFLDEDHAEIVAFREAHPTPENMPKPLSDKERQRLVQEATRLQREHEEMRRLIFAIYQGWSELEIALSALLYVTLNIEPEGSKIAYALYFSPSSLEARNDLVDAAVRRLIIENDGLAPLSDPWSTIVGKLNGVRNRRNDVAHGTPITIAGKRRSHVRLTSPAFDPHRVGDKLAKGQLPGLTNSDLQSAAERAQWLRDRVDEVNRVICDFRKPTHATFDQRLRELEAGLQT